MLATRKLFPNAQFLFHVIPSVVQTPPQTLLVYGTHASIHCSFPLSIFASRARSRKYIEMDGRRDEDGERKEKKLICVRTLYVIITDYTFSH